MCSLPMSPCETHRPRAAKPRYIVAMQRRAMLRRSLRGRPHGVLGSRGLSRGDMRASTAVEVELPQARELTGSIVAALRQLGGQAERREIIETAVEIGPFTDAQRAEPPHARRTKTNHRSQLHHRLSWAISHVRTAGEIESVRTGVWRLSND